MRNLSETNTKKYWAFISYSSKDKKWGAWLHKRLENYSIPAELQGIEFADGTKLGSRFRPIFRDRDELSSSEKLGPAIEAALKQSRYLIVLCSPNSAQSQWVNKEIEQFKRISADGKILALIIDGVPNATSQKDSSDNSECFPPALRYPMEPLAADLREEGDGKERGVLKLIAGMAEVGFDQLYRRHERILRKRWIVFSSIAMAIIAALASLSIFALYQKNFAESETVRANEEARRANESANVARTEQEKAIRLYNQAETENLIAKSKATEDPFLSLLIASEALRHSIDSKVEHKLARNHLHEMLSDYRGSFLHGHSLPVSCLAFDEDYTGESTQPPLVMLSGGADGRLIAWSYEDEKVQKKLVFELGSPVVACTILDDRIGVGISKLGDIVAIGLNSFEAPIKVHAKLGGMESTGDNIIKFKSALTNLQFHESCVVGVVRDPEETERRLLVWDPDNFHSLIFDLTKKGKCFILVDRIRKILAQHLKDDVLVDKKFDKLVGRLWQTECDYESLLLDFEQLLNEAEKKASLPSNDFVSKEIEVLQPVLVKDLESFDRLLAATESGSPLVLAEEHTDLLGVSLDEISKVELDKEAIGSIVSALLDGTYPKSNDFLRLAPESGCVFQLSKERIAKTTPDLEDNEMSDEGRELPESGFFWLSQHGEQKLLGLSNVSDCVISKPFSNYWSEDDAIELWLAVSDETQIKVWQFDNRELSKPIELGPSNGRLHRTRNNRWLVSFHPEKNELLFFDMFSDSPEKRVLGATTFPQQSMSYVGVGERFVAICEKNGTIQLFDTEEFLPEAQRRSPRFPGRDLDGPLVVEDSEILRRKISHEKQFSLVRKSNQPGDTYGIFGRYLPGITSSFVSSNGEHCVVNYDGPWYHYSAFGLSGFRGQDKIRNEFIDEDISLPFYFRWLAASNQLDKMIGVDDSGNSIHATLVDVYKTDEEDGLGYWREYKCQPFEIDNIENALLSPDGQWLVLDCGIHNEDCPPKIYKIVAGKVQASIDLSDVLGLESSEDLTSLGAFSGDSKSYAVIKKADDWSSKVVVLDLSGAPKIKKEIVVEDSYEPIVSLSDDGQVIAIKNHLKSKLAQVATIQVIDTKSDSLLNQFVLPTSQCGNFVFDIRTFDISETGRYLASAGDRGTIVWELSGRSSHENRWFFKNAGVNAVHVSEKFQSLLTLDKHGNGRNWQLSDVDLLKKSKRIVNRNFSESEWGDLRPGRNYVSTFPEFPAKPKREAGTDLLKLKSEIQFEFPQE